MTSLDWMVPGAVVLGCLMLMLIVRQLTRPKPPRWDIGPVGMHADNDMAPEPADIGSLAEWHAAHGAVVARWIDAHDRALSRIADASLQVDLQDSSITAEHDAIDPALEDAITAHPVPVMRAELSALRVAGTATVHAVKKSDYESAERHHLTYLTYREAWVDRLRQFGGNDAAIRGLPRRPDDPLSAGAQPPEAT